jgi:transcriptional regulator of acetoin/glycerol metabolism
VAPVYDHCGRLAAALDVSSCRADLTADFVGLITAAVAEAAHRIEARHFRAAFPGARIVLVPDTDWAAGAMLAIDRDDVVVGATRAARLACGITDALLLGSLRAETVLSGESGGENEEFQRAERVVVQRALWRATGNVSAAARALGVSRATMHRKMRQLGLRRGQAA